ncbi:MAG: DUF4339 domain-containing protein [bacterium]|nr:DUF4339 domain-containing protein [bacterium]
MDEYEGYRTKKDSLIQALTFSSLILLFLTGGILLNIDLKRIYLLKLKLVTVVESAANVGAFYLLDGNPKVRLMVNRFVEKSGLMVDNILIKTDAEAKTYSGRKLDQKENLVIAVLLNKKINLVAGRILGFNHQRIHTFAVAYHPPLQWYVLADKEYGPITLEELKNWCEQGRVLPDTLVKKGNGEYRCAKNFEEL